MSFWEAHLWWSCERAAGWFFIFYKRYQSSGKRHWVVKYWLPWQWKVRWKNTLHLLQFVVHANSPSLCLFGVFFFTLVFFVWVVYVTQVQLSVSTERIWKKRTPEFANFASILPSKSFCLLNRLTEQKARLKMNFWHLPCVFILRVCSLDLCQLITHWRGRAKIERRLHLHLLGVRHPEGFLRRHKHTQRNELTKNIHVILQTKAVATEKLFTTYPILLSTCQFCLSTGTEAYFPPAHESTVILFILSKGGPISGEKPWIK